MRIVSENKIYRNWIKAGDLISFEVSIKETDCLVLADKNLKKETEKLIIKNRNEIENYIEKHPEFLSSLSPIKVGREAPEIISKMAFFSKKVGVGPMASVAGAIAEFVGKELLSFSSEIIIENGGDIFLKSSKKRLISIYTGNPSLDRNFALEIPKTNFPLGIATSSGKIGHSLSFGKADAVTSISNSAIFSDALATAVCNRVKSENDIKKGIDFSRSFKEVLGIVIIINNKIGIWGNVKIKKI